LLAGWRWRVRIPRIEATAPIRPPASRPNALAFASWPALAEQRRSLMEIWINPACSKCRSALSLLDAEGAEYTVRRYLEQPPTVAELAEVLRRLNLEPWDVTRMHEPPAAELGMASWDRTPETRTRWLDALAAHPILLQRPIITAEDGTASIARTPEAVRSMLDQP
jgi:arsenate reductase (glutaredoxin)